MKMSLVILILLSLTKNLAQAEIIKVKCDPRLFMNSKKMSSDTIKRYVDKFIEWEIDTEKKIIRSLSRPFSDIPVLTGIVDQIPFESASKSKDKNYYLKYKSSLDIKGENNKMIKYKYSGEYRIYNKNKNKNKNKNEHIIIKINTGTFGPNYEINTTCKKEELDAISKLLYR